MKQSELNRAIARATGESVSRIARLGFVPLVPILVRRKPRVVNWDHLDAERQFPAPSDQPAASIPS